MTTWRKERDFIDEFNYYAAQLNVTLFLEKLAIGRIDKTLNGWAHFESLYMSTRRHKKQWIES